MQHLVAQGFGFGGGQVTGQGEQAEPGDEVGGDRRDLGPGLVDRELAGGEPAQAGVFGVPDSVFDAGVGAVPGLKEAELPGSGVGCEPLVTPAVAFLE